MSDDVTAWRVVADGDTIGTFDNFDDADGMAAAWNHAYPHEPWFRVVADLSPAAAEGAGTPQPKKEAGNDE